jgi:hypothetical protein
MISTRNFVRIIAQMKILSILFGLSNLPQQDAKIFIMSILTNQNE